MVSVCDFCWLLFRRWLLVGDLCWWFLLAYLLSLIFVAHLFSIVFIDLNPFPFKISIHLRMHTEIAHILVGDRSSSFPIWKMIILLKRYLLVGVRNRKRFCAMGFLLWSEGLRIPTTEEVFLGADKWCCVFKRNRALLPKVHFSCDARRPFELELGKRFLFSTTFFISVDNRLKRGSNPTPRIQRACFHFLKVNYGLHEKTGPLLVNYVVVSWWMAIMKISYDSYLHIIRVKSEWGLFSMYVGVSLCIYIVLLFQTAYHWLYRLIRDTYCDCIAMQVAHLSVTHSLYGWKSVHHSFRLKCSEPGADFSYYGEYHQNIIRWLYPMAEQS